MATAALALNTVWSPVFDVAQEDGVNFWNERMFRPFSWVQAAFLFIVGALVAWTIIRSYSSKLSSVATLARILGIGVAILGAGMGAGAWFESVYPPIFAITSIGMLTFFHLLYHSIRIAPDAPIQDRDLRIAITGSVTTMYLALVGFGAFMHIPATGIQQAPLAQSLVVSFTSVVGVVIAFYFGTSAYLESKKPGSPAQEPKSQQSASAAKGQE